MSKITSFTEGHTSSGFGMWYAAILDCGDSKSPHLHYAGHYQRFASTVKVGDTVECAVCENNRQACARLESLDISTIVYLRFNTRFGGRYLAYKRDASSPSGVINCDAFPATKEIDAIIDRRHICTMSPTEGR